MTKKLAWLQCFLLLLSLFSTVPGIAEEAYTVPEIKKADLADDRDGSETEVVFDGDTVSVSGSGASFADGVLTISEGGSYLFSGESDNGQILVSVSKDEKVRIILDGLTLHCTFGPCIRVDAADKAVLTLLEGSTNSLTDTENYTLAEGEDEPNACVYSKADLTVNGSGTLSVTALYRHGINSKDNLKILGGVITVNANEDGVRGKDSILLAGGDLTVLSKGDGLKSNNSDKAGKGFIYMTGGTLNVQAQEDALQAAQGLVIEDGTVTITTGEGSAVLSGVSENAFFQRGGWGSRSGWDRDFGSQTDTVSKKGLKSDGILVIKGGSVTADTEDDSLHAAKAIAISGGTLSLSSGDDGVHSDLSLLISGGTINVLTSYEALEAPVITIEGGVTRLRASDDGINTAGGEEETVTSSGRGFRGGMMFDTNANNVLRITDGYVYVNADGDGLDSNGYIDIDGGTVMVDGPTNSANAALDSGLDIVVSGGTLVAAGAAGMVELPSFSSAQPCLCVYASGNGGESITVLDENGEWILSYTPSKAYGCIILSSPALAAGNTCQVLSGADVSGEVTDGLLMSGTVSGGTSLGTVTLDQAVVTLGGSGRNQGWGQPMPGPSQQMPGPSQRQPGGRGR